MKSAFLFSFLLLSLSPPAIAAPSEDIIMQTGVDQKSLSWLVDKTRLILSNVDVTDGMTATTPLLEDPIIPLKDFGSNPKFTKLKRMLTQVFRIDFRDAALRIRIPRIYYHIGTLHAKANSFTAVDPTLDLQATAFLQGFDIQLLDGIQVDFMLLNPKSKKLESYLTGSLKPIGVNIPNTLPPAEVDLGLIATHDDGLTFKLKSFNLDKLPRYVDRHFGDFKVKMVTSGLALNANDIYVNPVIVKLSNMTRTIDFDDFKPLVQENLNLMLGKVLRAVGRSLKTSIGPSVLSQIFNTHVKSDLVVTGKNIYSRFILTHFQQPVPAQLSITLNGELCPRELFDQYGADCIQHREPVSLVREVPAEDQAKAKLELVQKLNSNPNTVACSFSEEYLNRILQTTMDANLWDEILSADHLYLGPKGAFVVFDQATSTPVLYLDLMYTGSGRGLERLFISEAKPIRFPLRMSTSISFPVLNDVPNLVIKTEKLLSDADEIMNGLPQYGIDSRLVRGLRNKIANMIVQMASRLENQTAIDLDLPMFKGLGLENSTYDTSAFGRLNLYFKI